MAEVGRRRIFGGVCSADRRCADAGAPGRADRARLHCAGAARPLSRARRAGQLSPDASEWIVGRRQRTAHLAAGGGGGGQGTRFYRPTDSADTARRVPVSCTAGLQVGAGDSHFGGATERGWTWTCHRGRTLTTVRRGQRKLPPFLQPEARGCCVFRWTVWNATGRT